MSLYDSLINKGRLEGKLEGKLEGLEEGKLLMILTMNAKGYSLKEMSDISGFTIAKVKKIISKAQN